jgi:hypothetical protein
MDGNGASEFTPEKPLGKPRMPRALPRPLNQLRSVTVYSTFGKTLDFVAP